MLYVKFPDSGSFCVGITSNIDGGTADVHIVIGRYRFRWTRIEPWKASSF